MADTTDFLARWDIPGVEYEYGHFMSNSAKRRIFMASILSLFLFVLLRGDLARGAEGQASVVRIASGQREIIYDDQLVTVKNGDRLLLEYRFKDVSHKPYVSQLTSPQGVNIVRDAPADHLHHHGLMFAWRVNGVNFWEEVEESGRELHDGWNDIRIATHQTDVVSGESISEYALLSERLLWISPSDDVLLVEERVLTVPFVEQDEPTVITWRSTFQVPKEVGKVIVTGTNYNGLGARFLKSMDKDGLFLNSAGKSGVEGTREKLATWCAYSANVTENQKVTVAMFDAQYNSRHPARWFTMNEPFAYLSATQGLHLMPLTITAEQPLTLTYGVGVFDGALARESLEKQYQRWHRKN